ncbi:MAG: DUF3488 and DUF4129 domain-containing transglutaminase family protein [Acidimicrobiales bacterium]
MIARPRPAPVVLEVAAALLVPASILSFLRVFVTAGAITPIIGACLLSTAVAVLMRRLRVPLSLSAVISALFLVALVVNRFGPGTSRFGLLPTSATVGRFNELVDELVLNFKELKTPVEALDPFIAAAMVGAWVMAFLTDWGALRLRLAFEPVLPAGLLFMFAAVLGEGTRELFVTGIFGAAIAVWAVTQRSVNLAEGNAWLANDRRRGSINVAQVAGVFAAIAVFGGVLVGPRLPGASADELLSFREQVDEPRRVFSPYVELTAQLVEQTGVQLFTVTAPQPSYWRMAGLDTYEESIWKVAGNFSPEDGRLPGQRDLGGARENMLQTYSVRALNSIWLPAAFAPSEIVETTAPITWNAETSSLTVATDVPSSNGVDYSLLSSVPRFTSDELRAAPDSQPTDIAERYLGLPELPASILDEAIRVTVDAPSRYDKMLTLQNYFRGFDYSVNLGPRQGDPIEQFLAERVGFCQQFAGTFAVMARLMGIPSRVAIGFTWGDPVGLADDGRTIYQITGRQAHAWPEIWFDGLGWVAFEPTPGRGAPSAVEYTSVPASQDSLVQPDNPGGPVTTTTTGASDAPAAIDDLQVPEFDTGGLPGEGGASEEDGGPSAGTILRLLAVVAVVATYAGGVPAWRAYRRQRRRHEATTPAAQVETGWAEVTESLELGYGLTRRPSETRREFARRMGADLRVPRAPVGELAELVTVARYHPTGLSTSDAGRAFELVSEIEGSINERVPAFTRWQRIVDPRRLLRPRTRMVAGPLAPPALDAGAAGGERQPVAAGR